MKTFLAAAALASASNAYAQSLASNCPTTGVCYKLNIPASTAQSGNGDIFFQLSAPTTYSWVALGQGSQMSGSNIFVMYTSANGQNVTVSPRLGTGHYQPQHDTSAQITLLEGTGVSNDMMTANVKCSNCQSWSGGSMDFTGANADWIYAFKSGNALNSDDPNESISKHDDGESFSWDLTKAQGGDSVNPFVSSATTPSGSTPSNNTSSNSNDTTSASSPSKNAPFGGNYAMGDRIITAHGVMASIAFVALFPTGGIIIRIANFTGLIWVHAALQMVAFGFYIIAFGMGVYIATELDIFDNHHPIVGVVLLIMLLVQPVSGFLHHRFFQKYNRRTGWSYEHLGIGRIAILLGLINGGAGLRLAGASTGAKTAYGVCAAIMAISYIVSIVIGERRRKRNAQAGLQSFQNSHRLQSSGGESPVQLREHFGNKA